MEDRILIAKQKLNINYPLKSRQIETLRALYNGSDCIAVLPTGYGKSLIYQLLPWVLQRDDRHRPGIVIVVCPLSAIIQDQITSLVGKGIRAVSLNYEGTESHSVEATEDDMEEKVKVVMADMTRVKSGDIDILYSHPEALFTKQISKMLRSDIYQDLVCCIAVDEVHMIEEWGEEFRPKFQQLGDLTSLFPNSGHLSVTATATKKTICSLQQCLQYKNPVIIKENPDRPNIFIVKKNRLPNIKKYEKYNELIQPIANELKDKLKEFPVTVIYVESLEALGYFYQFVSYELDEKQYIPQDEAIPENRIFAQYHKDYTVNMKQHIISEVCKSDPKIRLILATVALGMGLNAPSITRIIHCRPPTTLEKFFQEIGRAGRNGQQATSILYYNNSDICKSRKGITDAMIKFCKNNDSCLRRHLVNYFGFNNFLFDGPASRCCSNCQNKDD